MDEDQRGPRPDLSEWMQAQEVADWLGLTKRKLSAQKGLRCAVVSGERFYNRHDVAEFLERRADRQ